MSFGDATETPDTVAFDKPLEPTEYGPGPEHWIGVMADDLDPGPGIGVTGYWWNVTAIGPEKLPGLGKPPGRQFWIRPEMLTLVNPAPGATDVDYENPPPFEFTNGYTPSGQYRVFFEMLVGAAPGSEEILISATSDDTASFELPFVLNPGGTTDYWWGAIAHSDLWINDPYYKVAHLWGTNPAHFDTKAEPPPPAPQFVGVESIPAGTLLSAVIAFYLVAGATHYKAEAFPVDPIEQQTPIGPTQSWDKSKIELTNTDTPFVGQATGIPLPAGGRWMLLEGTDPAGWYQCRIRACKNGNCGPFNDWGLYWQIPSP
jgi:hypothetical protein